MKQNRRTFFTAFAGAFAALVAVTKGRQPDRVVRIRQDSIDQLRLALVNAKLRAEEAEVKLMQQWIDTRLPYMTEGELTVLYGGEPPKIPQWPRLGHHYFKPNNPDQFTGNGGAL